MAGFMMKLKKFLTMVKDLMWLKSILGLAKAPEIKPAPPQAPKVEEVVKDPKTQVQKMHDQKSKPLQKKPRRTRAQVPHVRSIRR